MAAVIYQFNEGAWRVDGYPSMPQRKDIKQLVMVADGNIYGGLSNTWEPKEVKTRILRNAQNLINVHPGVYGDGKNVCGDVRNVTGWIFRQRGRISNELIGDISVFTGDMSNIWGEIPGNLWGDVSGLRGDISKYSGDVTGIKMEEK